MIYVLLGAVCKKNIKNIAGDVLEYFTKFHNKQRVI